jgi:hypothetical protein
MDKSNEHHNDKKMRDWQQQPVIPHHTHPKQTKTLSTACLDVQNVNEQCLSRCTKCERCNNMTNINNERYYSVYVCNNGTLQNIKSKPNLCLVVSLRNTAITNKNTKRCLSRCFTKEHCNNITNKNTKRCLSRCFTKEHCNNITSKNVCYVIAVFLSETPRQTSFSVFVCYVIAVFLSETPRQTSFSVFVCYVIAVFLSETPR